MTTPRQRAVCVLGMHRSGTSLVARLVNLLGVDFGLESDVACPAPDNPKGFWEHPSFRAVNEAVLARIGHPWDDPAMLPAGWHHDTTLDDLRARAREAVAEFSSASVWGWKDPRTCLTLPFWQPLLPPTRYVVCLRNVADVARSLARRNGFAAEKSARLWLTHIAGALQNTTGQPRILLFYEDVMASRHGELERLEMFLGLHQSANDELQTALTFAIDSALQHHRTSIFDAADSSTLPFPARALYLLLRAAVARPGQDAGTTDPQLVEAITAAASHASLAQEHSARTRLELEQRDATLQARDEAIVWLRREIESTTQTAAAHEQMARSLGDQLVETNRRTDDLTRQLDSATRTAQMVPDLREQLAEAKRQVVRAHEHADHAAAAAAAKLAETTAALREREEGVAWLQGELAEARRQREQMRLLNESLNDQLQEIFASKGWRWLMRYRRATERLARRRPRFPSRATSIPAATAIATPHTTGPAGVVPASAPRAQPVVADTIGSLRLLPTIDAEDAARLLPRGIAPRARRGIDVVCFSIIDWEFRYQRPQQIMSQFAAHGHRVFYISPSRFRPPSSGSQPVVRVLKENVYEVQLVADQTPNVYGEVIDGSADGSILKSLSELRALYDIPSAVGYVMIASWTDVALGAATLWGWPVAYDCMDEWENFQGIARPVVAAEAGLVQRCDLLIVSASRLEEKWRSAGRPMVLARNGVDYEFYAARCAPNALLASPTHPIVGYFGAIADWFDIDLLTAVARQRPQYNFVLLGGVFGVDVRSLMALPNVALLGQQPYPAMPQYLYHFDACIIPFKINPITEATDPVKVYEYLSAGKPVVSVALPELDRCAEHIYIARDAADFVRQLDRAIAEDDPDLVSRRRQFAADQSWSSRYEQIHEGLVKACDTASIVIVTYNNVALTQLCLESILRNTVYPHYEVIVVDNGSTDGTRTYLRHMAATHAEVRVILNADNEGFPRANNQGLACSSGRFLVLLNNDTVVSPGWLARLVSHLRDPEVGLVGPVTNFVGNEAKIDVSYRTWEEMERFAVDRAYRYAGKVADIHMLAMFCVAFRRDTFDRVGPLDERFAIGMFEDDDYSQRVRGIGQRVVCAADVFVHHVGQAAFRTLIENGQYNAVFEQNRRAYEAKWQHEWKRHEHAALAFTARRPTGRTVHAEEV